MGCGPRRRRLGRLSRVAGYGDMAILLVEQYFEFARALADRYLVIERGEVVLAGETRDMIEADVRRHLTV
jgi:urea transport system ATP-binding protein